MNIFVTVGSGGFDALIRAADLLPYKMVCQIGDGSCVPRNARWFRTSPSLTRWYRWADVIVTHGGAATVFEALAHGKKVIVVPNTQRSDRHQEELAQELARRNHLVLCDDLRELLPMIAALKDRALTPYAPACCTIPDVIDAFLEAA